MPAPKTVKEAIDRLQELIDVQCSAGNWNYDEYMHGLANGLIVAMAVLTDIEPVYKTAPKVWLRDKKDAEMPSSLSPCDESEPGLGCEDDLHK